MLKQLDTNLWVAEQTVRYLIFHLETRITVIKQQNQQLAVISPIAPTEQLRSELASLGNIDHIIAPNCYHYLFAADFKAAYPQATLWAPPGLGRKAPNFPTDQVLAPRQQTLGSDLNMMFFEGYRTLGSKGFEDLNEFIFFHPQSRSLILTDAAFHFDDSFPWINFPWVNQLAARVMGSYQSLKPSILEKLALNPQQADKLRQSLEKVMAWDFERVIMAHGSVIETGGKLKLKLGYEQFLGS